jgi:N-acetylglucosaminyl-diphospho-decaprenol L-rhamnosyltransferase
MELSIIIVSLNVKPYLDHCLRSLFEALKGIDATVWVVDNASTDDTVNWLTNAYPQVRILPQKENLGFSKANNLALAQTDAAFTLFLNPDTIMEASCLQQCLAYMKDHPGAGALGIRMINGIGQFLKESKRGLPTPVAAMAKMSGLADLFPSSRVLASYQAGHLDNRTTAEVPVLSGAFMLVRQEVLKTVGSFDERFFLYAEDIDLSYRILKSGWKNIYFAGSTLIHFKGQSTDKKSPAYRTHFFGTMTQYVQKHYRGPLGLMYRTLLQTGILAQKFRYRLFPPAQTVTPDRSYVRWVLCGSPRDTQDFMSKYEALAPLPLTPVEPERAWTPTGGLLSGILVVFCLGETNYSAAVRLIDQRWSKAPFFFYHIGSEFLIGPDKDWPIPFRRKAIFV